MLSLHQNKATTKILDSGGPICYFFWRYMYYMSVSQQQIMNLISDERQLVLALNLWVYTDWFSFSLKRMSKFNNALTLKICYENNIFEFIQTLLCKEKVVDLDR